MKQSHTRHVRLPHTHRANFVDFVFSSTTYVLLITISVCVIIQMTSVMIYHVVMIIMHWSTPAMEGRLTNAAQTGLATMEEKSLVCVRNQSVDV